MHEPRPEDDLYTTMSAPDQTAPSLNGAADVVAITGEPPRKRSRTKGGRFAPVGIDTAAPLPVDPHAASDPGQSPHSGAVDDGPGAGPTFGCPTDDVDCRCQGSGIVA